MLLKRQKSAFTLIELLVVISIILIASSVIFIGGRRGGGAALSSSQRIVSGILQGARGQAILKNATTRLIIHNDPTEIDKYRRFFGIVYADPDNGSASTTWVAATQGTYLPEGIYFDAASSQSVNSSQWGGGAFTIEYPRAVAVSQGTGADFYYYEFKSNGTPKDGEDNAYLILQAATMRPDATGVKSLSVQDDEKFLRTGMIIRRAGSVTSISEATEEALGAAPTDLKQ